MHNASMLIRREAAGDAPAIGTVVAAAFVRPGVTGPAPEAGLVRALRADPAWIPALSMVAVTDGEITGHVLCTRGRVDDAPALGLGPLAVTPSRQRQGVGSALMHAVLGACEALGEPLVALLGDPAYYGRFGFRRSVEYGIEPPDPGWLAAFQVRVLSGFRGEHGTFRFPAPFDDL